MSDLNVIEKILRSMTVRFDYVVCSIEESRDLDSMTIDELQSSLLVHEQRMNGHNSYEEQVLKVAQDEENVGRGLGRMAFRGGATRGRGRGRGGRQPIDKSTIECYYCHEFGQFQTECPKKLRNNRANYVKGDEEAVLLMAQLSTEERSIEQEMWFIDSGCSNHMTGREDWFSFIDSSFSDTVKLGNNYALKVAGKGTVKLVINEVMHIVTDVFYVPELKNNLLSMGQLLEKGLSIEMKQNRCEVFQGETLIFETVMTTNRMFAISVKSGISQKCFEARSESLAQVWHSRYGHLSYSGLKTLLDLDMVKGLPNFKSPTQLCEHCLKGKHQRDSFPRQSRWRASQLLQLIHSDICGPINLTSNGNKRYILTFIDDLSRKVWVYFLTEKSEVFEVFKKFKALVEKQAGVPIQILRTDRGGEYTSKEFAEFCNEQGIQRQLTASYTPQQNGVAERKNQTIISMVRSVLSERKVQRVFLARSCKLGDSYFK